MFNKPTLLYPGKFTIDDLNQLRQGNKIWQEVTIYDSQVVELAEINFPGDEAARQKFIDDCPDGELAGSWIYYPWSGLLLHCVDDASLFRLRTNRNQHIISAEEQQKLAASTIAVAGMSVGSGIALACVYSGMSSTVKIADFDVLETANLNRLREKLTNIGQPKVILAAEQIYELNPYADVQAFPDGITADTIDAFFSDPAPSVVVDEIDDFSMKVQLRLHAKQRQIPLLMLTSLGDNILIDVERYDLQADLQIFNGALGDLPAEILQQSEFTPDQVKRYAVQLVGQQLVPTKAIASLLDIGTSLVGRPQLYSTIGVDAGLAAYVIRSIMLGEPVMSGRYFVKFAELIGMPSADLDDGLGRQEILSQLFSRK